MLIQIRILISKLQFSSMQKPTTLQSQLRCKEQIVRCLQKTTIQITICCPVTNHIPNQLLLLNLLWFQMMILKKTRLCKELTVTFNIRKCTLLINQTTCYHTFRLYRDEIKFNMEYLRISEMLFLKSKTNTQKTIESRLKLSICVPLSIYVQIV